MFSIHHLHAVVLAVALSLSTGVAFAHDDSHGAAHAVPAPAAAKNATPVQTPFGIAGDAAKATRTVAIDMSDNMRFEPAELAVRRGETVRFVLKNRGVVMHEMVIGTPAGLKEHAESMKTRPGMAHDEPNMTHVAPGATGEIVWQFNRAGTFRYACLVPGHFEAGMLGRIVVQ